MTLVVDTSIFIDHLRGDESARSAFARAWWRGERVTASVLTKLEILAGTRPHEERPTRGLLAQVEWLAVDDEIAEKAGALAVRYLRSHPGVEVVDYVVAASAEVVRAELWTTNPRHFPMFSNLTSPYAS